MTGREVNGPLDTRFGTANSTGTVSDYLVPESETGAYQIVGGLRDRVDLLGQDVHEFHHEVLEDLLKERAALKARSSVPTLLANLADERGMAWVDIARLVGVSVSAVRKWRTGGDATPASRLQLAELASFLDLLSEYAVEDPAQWMEMPLPLPAGHTVRPVDLYLAGHRAQLLDLAAQRRNIDQILDDIQPKWRDQASPFEVFDDVDGRKSIRPRRA